MESTTERLVELSGRFSNEHLRTLPQNVGVGKSHWQAQLYALLNQRIHSLFECAGKKVQTGTTDLAGASSPDFLWL